MYSSEHATQVAAFSLPPKKVSCLNQVKDLAHTYYVSTDTVTPIYTGHLA